MEYDDKQKLRDYRDEVYRRKMKSKDEGVDKRKNENKGE